MIAVLLVSAVGMIWGLAAAGWTALGICVLLIIAHFIDD